MSSLDRLATEVAALRRRVAELETRERVRAVPASGGTFTGSVTVGADTDAESRALAINAAAGNTRNLLYRSGGLTRWALQATSEAESGSNAGSNWQLLAFSDAQVLIHTPIRIVRATGSITFGGRVYAPSLRTNPATPEAGELYVDASGFVKRG